MNSNQLMTALEVTIEKEESFRMDIQNRNDELEHYLNRRQEEQEQE